MEHGLFDWLIDFLVVRFGKKFTLQWGMLIVGFFSFMFFLSDWCSLPCFTLAYYQEISNDDPQISKVSLFFVLLLLLTVFSLLISPSPFLSVCLSLFVCSFPWVRLNDLMNAIPICLYAYVTSFFPSFSWQLNLFRCGSNSPSGSCQLRSLGYCWFCISIYGQTKAFFLLDEI